MRRALSIIFVLILIFAGFGLTILFDFSTMNVQAAEKFGTIPTSENWNEDIYITGDVTIPTGVTVTIQQGITVQFNGSYSIIVQAGGKIAANASDVQPIVFTRLSGQWNTIEVQDTGIAYLRWCEFENSDNGITLTGNNLNTHIFNCSFMSTGTSFFDLTNSQLEVVSTKFEGIAFESTNFTSNLGKINLQDSGSELYIQYFVNVYTVNASQSPVKNIQVSISDSSTFIGGGRTGDSGDFLFTPATGVKISGVSNSLNFQVNPHTIDVQDKWFGSNRAVPGISFNSTIVNISYVANNSISNNTLNIDSNLHINTYFMFKYPPIIQTTLPKIKVSEDTPKPQTFLFFDNDDFVDGHNNMTIIIEDKDGNNIYNDTGTKNTEDKWVHWIGNYLTFYRTIESPNSPAPPDDYDAQIDEEINITISDDDGLKARTGTVIIEYHNVPDKPEILNLPSDTKVVEDKKKFIPISISDNDNATLDIYIRSDSDYISYHYNSSNDQSLKLNFPNEFGKDGTQQLVTINATDNCSAPVEYKFNILFKQTPDPPEILGTIPDKIGNETAWTPELLLREYWIDSDPDDDETTLEWYVTDVNKNIFEVSGDNVSANTSLNFNLISSTDLGGARNPQVIEDKVTVWLKDQFGLTDSQEVTIKLFSTNLQPSLHKVERSGNLVTVEPEQGDSETYFRFMIEYKDQDGEFGDAPEYVRVVIDNKTYEMNESNSDDTDFTNGKRYYMDIKLSPGIHEHYFICSDTKLIAHLPDAPEIIELPIVKSRIYEKEFKSLDNNFKTKIGFSGSPAGWANINSAPNPTLDHEANKGDIDAFFRIDPFDMSSISWIDITIDFGNDFINYKSRWLRKDDMELAFEKDNNWVTIDNSKVEKDKHMLKCNITPEPLYGFDVLFDDILSRTNSPVFTVTGWLDADGDDYYNDEDAFPFDPAARYDSDGDGSPGNNEWVPGKGPSQSTTDPPLYEDRFPNDPAASIDDDNDGCPDKWNPGMSGKNSTTNLTLDKFPGETDKCLDTDNDNLPDGDKYNSENWMDRDDDDDDIPDYWELAKNDEALERGLSFLFDPKDRNDGAADWDGDGRNNTQEYYDKTDPFKKDKPEEEDDGVLSIAGSNMFLIGLIIVIVLIILLVVFLRMRGKKEPEELPRGMGGAPPPEEPMPEEITDTGYEEEGVYEEEEILEEPLGEEDTGEIYDETGEEIGLDEQTGETTEEGGVVQPEGTTEIETDTGVEEGTGELEQGPEMMEDTGETETAGESETIESTEGTVNEPVQFTCPNCNTLVTPDMPACPGCKTPLTFDQ